VLLDELANVPLIHVQALGLAERYNFLYHCRAAFESFKVRLKHDLRSHLLSLGSRCPLCNTLLGHINYFKAYRNVIAVLPELSKGEVCALRHLKAAETLGVAPGS